MTARVRYVVWAVLAIPALVMVVRWATGAALPMDLLHPSGEWSVRLMVAAMLAGPLAGVLRGNRFVQRWLQARRALGVAAFGYAVLHVVFYAVDMGALAEMIDELSLPPIWTGWVALVLMAIPAALSRNAAVRALGPSRWKAWQRLVYPTFIIALAHWWLLDWEWLPVALHALSLAAAWIALIALRRRSAVPQGAISS